jgi:hypothetical protein
MNRKYLNETDKTGIYMKTLCVAAIFLLCNQAVACPNILGTWQSSKELSEKYNQKNAQLSQAMTELLKQILGILKLTYTESAVHEHGAPTIKVTIKGKQSDFYFEDLNYKYEVLSCTNDSITLKSYYPYIGEPLVTTINFVNENLYWETPQHLPKSREYFIRILH